MSSETDESAAMKGKPLIVASTPRRVTDERRVEMEKHFDEYGRRMGCKIVFLSDIDHVTIAATV